MQVGVVGLPNAGKSTLFNAITKAGAEMGSYAFTTIDPNIGIAEVPDERLAKISALMKSEKTVFATMKFVDIAGLVKGASKGEGLGNKFLAHIREVDVIAHVVRCFGDENVSREEGGADPLSDIETINIELILSDLAAVEKRLEKAAKQIRTGSKELERMKGIYERLKVVLEAGSPARSANLSDEEETLVSLEGGLITLKPIIYVANVAEGDLSEDNPLFQKVLGFAKAEGSEAIAVSAKLEVELAELSEEEAATFKAEMGITESGLSKFIRASYKLLGLVTFFTAGPKEARAWSIKAGTKAPGAAGRVHSDMERGFIKAEVVYFTDLLETGSFAAAKEKGLLRLEGKDYVVKDGDVITFKFAV
ncbi:MAG: redox-regulated ATPase YchF [Actinomycetota bacterium]|nr:redox-regulated ATPase YchF [Actinomycetota bacterium]